MRTPTHITYIHNIWYNLNINYIPNMLIAKKLIKQLHKVNDLINTGDRYILNCDTSYLLNGILFVYDDNSMIIYTYDGRYIDLPSKYFSENVRYFCEGNIIQETLSLCDSGLAECKMNNNVYTFTYFDKSILKLILVDNTEILIP